MKWNIDSWQESSMTDSAGELLHERFCPRTSLVRLNLIDDTEYIVGYIEV